MENASKALIMVAGVLIGILIISLAVYLFVDFGTRASEVNSKVAEQQVVQFNNKFTSYEGKNDLNIYDVVTVASYAYENNLYYQDVLNEYKIEVYLANPVLRQIQDNINETKISLINSDKNSINSANLNLPTYSCKVTKYHNNGRVYKLQFTKL